LPIRIGSGPAADIRLPGPATGEIVALISSLDDRPFVQSTGATAPRLAVNGEPVSATRWLADADLIDCGALRIQCRFDASALCLSVAYADTQYATLPPVAAPDSATASVIEAAYPRAAVSPSRKRRARWPWLVYGVLLLLALAAFQLFTAKAVHVAVEPAQADINIESWLALRIGERYLLQPGRYELHMSAAGYAPQREIIQVGEAQSQEFKFKLQKLPGRVVIAAKP
jgi:hypothetical protein